VPAIENGVELAVAIQLIPKEIPKKDHIWR
jgi:hypothetical protein